MKHLYKKHFILFGIIGSLLIIALLMRHYSSDKNVLAGQDMMVVNTEGEAERPDLAINQNGDGVIVWQQKNKRYFDIYAQRIDLNGEKISEPFRVNQYTLYDQKFPKAVIDQKGNFIVVWQSYFQDRNGSGIYGQKFRANGKKWGSEFKVHSFVLYNQLLPDIAMNADGDFIVTWVSEYQDNTAKSIYAQLFNSDGSRKGKEIKVNIYNRSVQTNPVVAINALNQIMIVWQSDRNTVWDIYARLLNWEGERLLKDDLLVNTQTSFNQTRHSITTNAQGQFLVTWVNEQMHKTLDFVEKNVLMQVLDGTGNKIGIPHEISSLTLNQQDYPKVISKQVDSLVVWQAYDDQSWHIWGQYLNLNYNLLGTAFKITEDKKNHREWNLYPALEAGPTDYYSLVRTEMDLETKQKRVLYKRFKRLYDLQPMNVMPQMLPSPQINPLPQMYPAPQQPITPRKKPRIPKRR